MLVGHVKDRALEETQVSDDDTRQEMPANRISELNGGVADQAQAESGSESGERSGRKNGHKYYYIFETAPVSIWEEDVSQLRAAIADLKAQGISDFKRFLLEHPDFVYQAARLIRVVDVNQETVRMYGAQSEQDLLGSPAKVLMPESSEAFREQLVAIETNKRLFETEAVTQTLDGTKLNVLVRISIPGDASDFGSMLVIVTDITERRRAEEALRRSEELFRALFDSARDCIYVKDVNLRFTHVNPAMARLLELPASEICGRRAEDFFGQEAGKHILQVELRVLTGESIEEEHARPINGWWFTFHDIRVPLHNAAGEIIGICGISRDVSERKRVRPSPPAVVRSYPSQAMSATLTKARQAAQTDSIILLTGESGSGKDFLARWIHDHSQRAGGPFFAINCAAVPQELAESELFGHEAGAYTGARNRKRGLLELAEGGTLLLNEIAELSLSLQSKLLSFLDTRAFLRVGGEKSISVSARLIAATHRDLETEVAHGRFQQALWYRLNVLSIAVPPLRERLQDIPILVEEMMSRLATDMRLSDVPVVDPEAMKSLIRYHWPGNVRELRNVLERALMLSEKNRLEVSLPRMVSSENDLAFKFSFADGVSLGDILDQVTQSLCKEALCRSDGRREKAAELLRISRTSLYRHMKKFGMLRENETTS